jgi:hypothetical protein
MLEVDPKMKNKVIGNFIFEDKRRHFLHRNSIQHQIEIVK